MKIINQVGFIGAGKLGTAFSNYLNNSGISVVGIYSPRFNNNDEISLYNKIAVYKNMENLVVTADVIFITTPDDTIETVVKKINEKDMDLKDKLFIHCSGAISSTIFQPLIDRGAKGLSLHLLKAFSGNEQSDEMTKIYLTYEGEERNHPFLKELGENLSNPIVWIDRQDKSLYHASAVTISNYFVTLIYEGLKLLEPMGIDEKKGFEMMEPLLISTLENIRNKGTVPGLTGPIKRQDLKTIKLHIQQLNERFGRKELEFYQNMGKTTLKMLEDQNIDTDKRLWEMFEVKHE